MNNKVCKVEVFSNSENYIKKLVIRLICLYNLILYKNFDNSENT